MNDLFVFAIVTLLLYHVKPVKPVRAWNEDYLSLETCGAFRGFFALTVIMHHLAQRTGGGVMLHWFTNIGHLPVAVFFFFSGYGLMKRHITSPEYYKRFLAKRIPSVLVPYLLVSALCWVFEAANGNVRTVSRIVMDTLRHGSPIVPFSWYILAILWFYGAFWLLMRVFQRHYGAMIIGMCCLYGLYVLLCRWLGYGEWWYNAACVLVVGMIWAYKESDWISWLKRNYAIAAVVMPVVLCVAMNLSDYERFDQAALVFQAVGACSFSVILVLFSLKIMVGNRILGFLGKISLEIYMLQGMVMSFLRSDMIYIQNEFLWCGAVLSLTVALAAVFHIIFQKILSFIGHTIRSAAADGTIP